MYIVPANASSTRIDVHYRVLLRDMDLPPHAEPAANVEEADVKQVFSYLRPELLKHGYMYPQGVLAITVDGEPWNGGFDNYGEVAPRVLYFRCRDFYCEVDWLRAMASLLEGERIVVLCQDDDETPPSIGRSRHNRLKIWHEGFAGDPLIAETPVIADLLEFAAALVVAGESLLRFSYRLLGEAYAQLAIPGLSPLATRGIEHLIQYIQAWEVKIRLAELRKALDQFGKKPSLKHVWNDVLDLMADFPPSITQERTDREGRNGILQLQWDQLQPSELPYLQAMATLAPASKKVVWQNPFQSRPLAHYLVSLEVMGHGAVLRLRTTLGKGSPS